MRGTQHISYHNYHLVFSVSACTKLTPQELKNSRTEIYLKLINDGVSVARKKSFDFSRVTRRVFQVTLSYLGT